MPKKKINEGIINRFIDGFFDSYKKGLQKQFINKSAEKNPEVANALKDVEKDLVALRKKLEKIVNS